MGEHRPERGTALRLRPRPDGRVAVEVRQVVRALDGTDRPGTCRSWRARRRVGRGSPGNPRSRPRRRAARRPARASPDPALGRVLLAAIERVSVGRPAKRGSAEPSVYQERNTPSVPAGPIGGRPGGSTTGGSAVRGLDETVRHRSRAPACVEAFESRPAADPAARRSGDGPGTRGLDFVEGRFTRREDTERADIPEPSGGMVDDDVVPGGGWRCRSGRHGSPTARRARGAGAVPDPPRPSAGAPRAPNVRGPRVWPAGRARPNPEPTPGLEPGTPHYEVAAALVAGCG